MTDRQNISEQSLCLVTGANTGIGFEIARGLATAGARVILACRDQAKGHAALETIEREIPNASMELLIIDLSSQKSIRTAARAFFEKHPALDVLLNNAGIGSYAPSPKPGKPRRPTMRTGDRLYNANEPRRCVT